VLFATLLGFLLSVGGAFALDELNRSIKNRRELRDLGLIPIGSVPWVQSQARTSFFGRRKKSQLDLLAPWQDEEETSEILAIKHIRAMVSKMRSPSGEPAKVICVLGATPGDGKSFLSVNLGIALAQSGKQTLLLDGDLRRPTLASRL